MVVSLRPPAELVREYLPAVVVTGALVALWWLMLPTPLVAPQNGYPMSGPSMLSLLVNAVAMGAVLLLLGWFTHVPWAKVARWLGFVAPLGGRRRWLWLPAAVVVGVVLYWAISGLLEMVPQLTAQSAEQAAADAQRRGVLQAPAWMWWLHVAGEEVQYRVPVVAAAVWAFGAGPVRQVPVVRVVVLVVVSVAMTVAFALSHAAYSWANVGSAAVMGAMCAAVAVWSRSLWPAIGLHVGYNSTAALLTHLW